MGKGNNVECHNDGGAVENALAAEQSLGQRQGHVADIAVDCAVFVNAVSVAVALGKQGSVDGYCNKMQEKSASDSDQKLPSAVPCEFLSKKRIDNNARCYYIEKQVGAGLARFLGKPADLVADNSDKHHDIQYADLTRRNENIVKKHRLPRSFLRLNRLSLGS